MQKCVWSSSLVPGTELLNLSIFLIGLIIHNEARPVTPEFMLVRWPSVAPLESLWMRLDNQKDKEIRELKLSTLPDELQEGELVAGDWALQNSTIPRAFQIGDDIEVLGG